MLYLPPFSFLTFTLVTNKTYFFTFSQSITILEKKIIYKRVITLCVYLKTVVKKIILSL